MPFLDGRAHIYECANGHQWESGDREHHPFRPWETLLCPHNCGALCVKMTCPADCWGPERSRARRAWQSVHGRRP
jgi:hypothetical protein